MTRETIRSNVEGQVSRAFDCRTMLKNELRARKSRNPSYSLRSFARDLTLSPSFLSRILSDSKKLTFERAVVIAHLLNWSPSKRAAFIMMVIAETVPTKKLIAGISDRDKDHLDSFLSQTISGIVKQANALLTL